jgi:ribosomal protein L12E/L44/L45/RPP1/RPP2
MEVTGLRMDGIYPIKKVDANGKDATDLLAIQATLLLLVGVILLGSADKLNVNISYLTTVLERWQAVLKVSNGAVVNLALEGNNIEKAVENLNKLKSTQAARRGIGKSAVGVAFAGYMRILSALLKDIDIASDGPGSLETLFGG